MKREATILREFDQLMADEQKCKVLVRALAKEMKVSPTEMLRRLEQACEQTRRVTEKSKDSFISEMNSRMASCVSREFRDNINKVWELEYQFLVRYHLLCNKAGSFHWQNIYALNRLMKEETDLFLNYYGEGEMHKMLTYMELATCLARNDKELAASYTKNFSHYECNLNCCRETIGQREENATDILARRIKAYRKKS